MADSLVVRCPNCNKGYRAPTHMIGKAMRCKGCQSSFAVRETTFEGQSQPDPEADANPYSSRPETQERKPTRWPAREVSQPTMDLLVSTRPWVRVTATTYVLGALVLVLAGALDLVLGAEEGEVSLRLLTIAFGVLLYSALIYPLLRYSSAITRLATSRKVFDLEAAVRRQRDYWVVFGLLSFLVIAGTAVLLLGSALWRVS